VICSPPVNKLEDLGRSSDFVRGLESGRVNEESERSDGGKEGRRENMRDEVTKVDMFDGRTALGQPSQRPVSWSPQNYSGFPLKDPSSTKGSPTISSPFAKFQQLEQQLSRSNPEKGLVSSLCRNSSMPSSPRPVSLTLPSPRAVRSSSGAKELILSWVQTKLKNYPIPVTNFSSCWNDGLAFCALIHVFYPDNFDWFALKAENRRYNFTLGFEKAEELADIYPLLEVEDMVRFQTPDWKCVFTYVQSFYRRFREDRIIPHRYPGNGTLHSQDIETPNQDNKSPLEKTSGGIDLIPISSTNKNEENQNQNEEKNENENRK